MMSVHSLIFAITCATVFTAVVGTVSQQISDGTTQFSLNLLKTVLQDHPGNVIISPVSLYTVLAMLQQGAHSGSQVELTNVLHAPSDETKEGYHNLTTRYQNLTSVTMDFASRVFVRSDRSILPEFKESLVSNFLTDIDPVNFSDPTAASEHINSWVSQSTHDRITKLFEPGDIPANAFLVLANAIYFNANWKNRFQRSENRTFSPGPNEEKQVPSMYQEEIYDGGVDTELGAKWVHMNLLNTYDFTVLLVLPTERHGLDNLVNRLTAGNLTTMLSHSGFKNVKLTLPKFTVDTDSKLVDIMKKLGVNDIFSSNADLSGIAVEPLQVSDIVQKAEIAVDEEGVTATAASAVMIVTKSALEFINAEELIFTADEPFLIFIIDRRSSVPLFAGRVSDPSTN